MDITEQLTHESRIALAAAAEITRLRARLEVRDDGGPDGILCRDESIRMQDAEIARLRAEVEALRADAATDRKLVQAAEKFIQPVLQELQFERGHGSLAVHNLRLVLIEAMKANARHAEIDAARAAQGGE